MRQFPKTRELEKGQVIPIVIIMFFAIVGMTALILDGGSVMLSRRSIQAAADSGAMAGATELCYSTGADPLTVAENFAINNGATTATAQYMGGAVKVTAIIEYDSFFAKVFNQDTLSASAEATAGCFPPSGNSLLPVAWSCRPPVGGGVFDPGKGCQVMALDWNNLLRPLLENEVASISIPGNEGLFEKVDDSVLNINTGLPPDQIYIIMDEISTNNDTLCKEDLNPSDPLYDTAITCDLDGNGKMDIEGAGNRGWLDLNGGGGGASEIRNWVINGFDGTILPHTWLAGQPGQQNSTFQAVRDYRVGDVVMIPVFNALCDDKNPTSNQTCMDAAHASPFPSEPATGDISEGGHKPTFHIITFSPFYISCAHVKKSDYCPGFELAQAMNPSGKHKGESEIGDNVPAVEGFFLENVNVALDLLQVCDVNLGNCEVSLVD
ncbi:MAG: pilus assembly protein TadG-related protein [Chloroflexota bacterium]|nr:pilus assembly protein TadG-related protein [Chloroflexota bacterium]